MTVKPDTQSRLPCSAMPRGRLAAPFNSRRQYSALNPSARGEKLPSVRWVQQAKRRRDSRFNTSKCSRVTRIVSLKSTRGGKRYPISEWIFPMHHDLMFPRNLCMNQSCGHGCGALKKNGAGLFSCSVEIQMCSLHGEFINMNVVGRECIREAVAQQWNRASFAVYQYRRRLHFRG